MVHLDFNWEELETFLPLWDKLSPEAREAFILNVSPQPEALTAISPCRQELKNAGLIYEMKDGVRFYLPEQYRRVNRALRAMEAITVFHSPVSLRSGGMLDYLADHFTSEELSRLGSGYHGSWRDVARRAESVSWITEFLKVEDEDDWEDQINKHGYGLERSWVEGSFKITREVVGQLYREGKPQLFSEAMKASPLPAAHFLKGLYLACREIVLFVDLCPQTKELRVGLWPKVAGRLHAPKPVLPESIPVAQSFASPVLIHDVFSLVSLCSIEPIRLRVNDGSLFAKFEKLLLDTMLSGPQWLPYEYGLQRESRIVKAVSMAVVMGLLKGPTSRQRKNKPELKITPLGRKWLGYSEKDRLLAVWSSCGLVEKPKSEFIGTGQYDVSNFESCFPFEWHALDSFGSPEWDAFNSYFTDLILELAQATENGFVDLTAFLRYAALVRNPFKEKDGEALWDFFFADIWWSWKGEEDQAQVWVAGVLSFLVRWGVPLGIIAIATSDPESDDDPDGYEMMDELSDDDLDTEIESNWQPSSLCLQITELGRFTLGLHHELHVGPESTADIIVQPNFEVVFLGYSDEAEIRLVAIAERLGRGTGTLFRLTKASVQKAAATGMSGDVLLAMLAEIASKPLPENVTHQLRHWVGQATILQWRPAMVVTCPDHDCALQVIGTMGQGARLLNETTVELTSGKPNATMVKKLQKVGIFLNEI